MQVQSKGEVKIDVTYPWFTAKKLSEISQYRVSKKNVYIVWSSVTGKTSKNFDNIMIFLCLPTG